MQMTMSITGSPIAMLSASRVRGPVVIPPQGLKRLPDDVIEQVAEQLDQLPPRWRHMYWLMLAELRRTDPVAAQRFVASMRGKIHPGNDAKPPDLLEAFREHAAKAGFSSPDMWPGTRGAPGAAVVFELV
ncbi:MAG: hypothetical protein FJX76_20405 [Armatimonadetes bacterium]|nr:hypothetical protein [Armatimonadota bacterium]